MKLPVLVATATVGILSVGCVKVTIQSPFAGEAATPLTPQANSTVELQATATVAAEEAKYQAEAARIAAAKAAADRRATAQRFAAQQAADRQAAAQRAMAKRRRLIAIQQRDAEAKLALAAQAHERQRQAAAQRFANSVRANDEAARREAYFKNKFRKPGR